MSWIYLILAGFMEVLGVFGIKKVSEKGSFTIGRASCTERV